MLICMLISCMRSATLACYEELYIAWINSDIALVYSLTHSLRVHQWGLFAVNTAGAWYLCGRHQPTWKPYRRAGTPMCAGVPCVCMYVSRGDGVRAMSIACKNMRF